MQCRNCGDVVDEERVRLGYDYCLKPECQARCMKRVLLASVGVNKAADHYAAAADLLPPLPPPTPVAGRVAEDDEGDPAHGDLPPLRGPAPPAAERRPSTLERLEALGRELDAAIARGYDRFCRGEVTAAEMHAERRRMIRAYNGVVRAENIRYRSLLRSERG